MLWLAGLVLALLCTASCLQSIYPGIGLLFELVIIIVSIHLFVAAVVAAAFAGFQRKWRKFGWRTGVVVASVPLALLGLASGDYIHFAIMYPHYRAVIAKEGKRPIRFPWGDSAVTVLDGLHLRVLTFDDAGALDREVGLVGKDENGLSHYVNHFIGHFYFENISSHE